MHIFYCLLQGFCCEIDEPCEKIRPYITVDNCLTFGHEYAGFNHKDGYWNEGSLARKTIFGEQQEEKKKKGKKDKKKEKKSEDPSQ